MSKREREEEEESPEVPLADVHFLLACYDMTAAAVEKALREGANLHATGEGGRTALMAACCREPDEHVVVQLLLRLKCPVRMCDLDGWNALHCACLNSSAEVLQLLLAADSSAAARFGPRRGDVSDVLHGKRQWR
jgi:ankyrin repeat protein